MALTAPSPDSPFNGPEWQRFLIQLGQPTSDPSWYGSLKLLADTNGISIPSPAEPMASGGKVSTAWYPALQRLAAAI